MTLGIAIAIAIVTIADTVTVIATVTVTVTSNSTSTSTDTIARVGVITASIPSVQLRPNHCMRGRVVRLTVQHLQAPDDALDVGLRSADIAGVECCDE